MNRRHFIRFFIVCWLVLQISIPFFRKFDLLQFKYRYATFSWAMYSKPALEYEVILFQKTTETEIKPIKTIGTYVQDYQSPEPMAMREYYRSTEEIKNRFKRLVEYVAQREDSNLEYGVQIRWIKKFDPKEPAVWEYHV